MSALQMAVSRATAVAIGQRLRLRVNGADSSRVSRNMFASIAQQV
jgi:hypothetical protein